MEHESIHKITKYDSNPYILDVLPFIKTKDSKVGYFKDKNGFELLDANTGEVKTMYNAIYAKKQVDSQQYNKIYVSGITALFDLNKSEQKVLKYLYSKIEKNKDYIIFNVRECKEFCDYSSNQIVYTAIAGLINKKIVARSEDSYKLWINPTIMFNGDRLLIVNEYIKNIEPNRIEGKDEPILIPKL